MRGKCCNISFCAAEMMLSLSHPYGDRIISLSLLDKDCIVHPHCDTTTYLIIRTSELNDIFRRLAKNTVANLHVRGIIYYTLGRDFGCLMPGIKCDTPATIQDS